MTDITQAVDAVQEVAAEASPAPAKFERVAPASDVKARLDWGEPALTIIDVRDRESFNSERIKGAIHIPKDELVSQVEQTLEKNRDIYIYGDDEGETVNAAAKLESSGFKRVSILDGGLSAWKAVGGSTEGRNG